MRINKNNITTIIVGSIILVGGCSGGKYFIDKDGLKLYCESKKYPGIRGKLEMELKSKRALAFTVIL